ASLSGVEFSAFITQHSALSTHDSSLGLTQHSALITSVAAPFSQKSPGVMARGVRRRWVLDLHGIRREGTKESGFSYRRSDGTPIKEEKTLARIGRLRIPPAW